MNIPPEGLQLQSLVTGDSRLALSLQMVEVPDPKPDEVLVRVDAAPINPTDLALLFGPADLSTLKNQDKSAGVVAEIPPRLMGVVKPRIDKPLAAGAEGAGVVVAAGNSERAQGLLGKTVAMVGDGMFSQYRCLSTDNVFPTPDHVSARDAASSYVNPMTALAMVETMHAEGHTAIVHTVASSNLGQMLNRLCVKDGVGLVNIVRSEEQAELLRQAGANHVINSSSDDFRSQLTEAIAATGATLAFDAIGGGRMANTVLSCMERASSAGQAFNRYGSETFKQLYVYGRLDLTPQEFTAAYGFSWSVGGWLLSHFLHKAPAETIKAMRQRVIDEISSTFVSHYAAEVSLQEAISTRAIQQYSQRSSGNKYLVLPNKL